jgi:hypothetical protein
MIPENGAVVSFEYEIDGGFESYTQNWAENLFLDGSKPLTILKHLGGNPLCAFAARQKKGTVIDGFFTKWIGRAVHYCEHFAMQDDPDEEDVELYESFKNAMAPFGERLAKTTKDHLAAAMKDGQVAIVLDSKLEPKTQWLPMMPPADEPLGMFEFSEVYGVEDVDQLETAFTQYREIVTEAIEKLKEVTQENQQALMERLEGQAQMLPIVIQQLRLPTPETGESDHGKLFFLNALQQVGMDASVAPSMGWSEDVLVMSNTPDGANRILAENSLDGMLAEQAERNLAGAMHVNFAGLMDMLKPWVSYGLKIAADQQDNEMISMFTPQVETLLDVMKCLREYSSVTFIEGDSMVTFRKQMISDLE